MEENYNMIEINIPTSTAVIFLTERMRHEFSMRTEAELITPDLKLEELNGDELIELAEIAAFDLILLLPAEIYSGRNNLADIITNAFEALSSVFNRKEFTLYGTDQAEKLILPIKKLFDKASEEKHFLNN